MKRTVEEHILRIKAAIETLENHPRIPRDATEDLQTQNDLRSLRMALMHYELALQIEQEVIYGRMERNALPTISTRH